MYIWFQHRYSSLEKRENILMYSPMLLYLALKRIHLTYTGANTVVKIYMDQMNGECYLHTWDRLCF